MPWHSGSWGPEEQIRSKRRLDYFQKYNKKKYELNREEIIAKATQYYNLNREAISAKQAINYQKKKLKK
jgi:hypothetical protein